MMASPLDEEDLATYGRNAWTRFNVAYKTLEKNDSTISEQPDAAALRSEMQRFQLWAINLGLLRQDHSSLDYRLRDNEVVRAFTRELLVNLTEALEEITNIASSGGEESESRILETPNPDASGTKNDAPFSVSNDEGSSIGPIMMGSLSDENESLLMLYFEDVTEAVNQMYNLASQIRSPKTRQTRNDVDLYKEVDGDIKSEYVKLRKAAELQGIEQILLQSRKSLLGSQIEEKNLVLAPEDQRLIQRLQQANHARRQQFEYWKRSKKRSVRAAFRAIQIIPDSKHDDEKLQKVLKHETQSSVQPSDITRSLLSSVPALPKDFVPRGSKSTYSGTSRGLTLHGPFGEKINWPKPPVAGPCEEDFECPFCFYFCTPRYSEDAAWRSHLKHDLRPYVCTYDECNEPNVLYDSWEEWTRHEQWAHQQRVWRCLEHPQPEYVERAAYEDHVRIYHAASVDQLLSPELLNSRESVSQLGDRPCPFCQRDFERPVDLQEHIAGHLESIALLSLPNLDDIDQNSEPGKANSNSANLNYAESKAGDFDFSEPLLFFENEHSGAIPSMTKTDSGLFDSKLKAEGASFNSTNEFNLEARQAYSIELVGGWLSCLPHEIHDNILYSSEDTSHQDRRPDIPLIAIAEKARMVASALDKFLGPVKDQSAEITALMAECLETNLVLQKLGDKIGGVPYHRRYSDISRHLTTVNESLNLTFRDIQRLFRRINIVAVTPHEEFYDVWGDLCHYFLAQSGFTLRRRMEYYNIILDEVFCILTEGLPSDPDYFDEVIVKLKTLLTTQQQRFTKDYDGIDLEDSGDTGSISSRKKGPADEQMKSRHLGGFPDQPETVVSNHWLPTVFYQSPPSTKLEDTRQVSICLAETTFHSSTRLEENGYVKLFEELFDDGDFLVGLYQRLHDCRSKFLCRAIRPAGLLREKVLPLTSLIASRRGPMLIFCVNGEGSPKRPKLWACLKFSSYERMVLFYCSFLALIFEDTKTPVRKIVDYDLHMEMELFAGRIADDYFDLGLRLFRENDTGVVRLQASAQTGPVERKPIWTAFITHQILSPSWVLHDGSRGVHLADLQQYIFTQDWKPQMSPTGEFELIFTSSADAEAFMEVIKDLRNVLESHAVPLPKKAGLLDRSRSL